MLNIFIQNQSDYKKDIIEIFENNTLFNECGDFCGENSFITKLYDIYSYKNKEGYHKFVNNTELISNNYIYFSFSIIGLPTTTMLILLIYLKGNKNLCYSIAILI